ncbi:MAG: hypothetical protein K8I60_07485 [Anaerolineae bacterium]|nr:hypothetical protein [Anaerolineae bacterium]
MRKRALFILIALLLVMPLVMHAEGDPHENACYEGGSMWRESGDGCPTEWHWIVGWYLANWENNGGWSNPDNPFPDWADPEHVLPPNPGAAPVVENPPSNGGNNGGGGDNGGGDNNNADYPSATCVQINYAYVNFQGGWSIPNPAQQYSDSSCTTPNTANFWANLIYAPAPYDAAALCAEAFPGTVLKPFQGDIYVCLGG